MTENSAKNEDVQNDQQTDVSQESQIITSDNIRLEDVLLKIR